MLAQKQASHPSFSHTATCGPFDCQSQSPVCLPETHSWKVLGLDSQMPSALTLSEDQLDVLQYRTKNMDVHTFSSSTRLHSLFYI